MKTEIIKNEYGIFECFSNDRHITKHIKQNKIFHPTLYHWIKNYLEGDLLDIGANIGCYSIPIAKEFKNYKVHSVEAHPEIFGVLNHNIVLNKLDNMTAYNFGALDKEQTLFLQPLKDIDNFNTGDMRLSSQKSNIPLNCFRCDNKINDIECSVIKIDAQGSDYEALLGCEKIIDKHRPCIIIEWEQHMVATNTSIKDVIKYLQKFNYILKETYMRDFLFTRKNNHD